MSKITDPALLTFSVNSATNNLRFDTANKTIELVASGSLVEADGVTGQCLFSKIKEVLRSNETLRLYRPPVLEMIHDESMELVYDWKFKDTSSLKMVRDCGVAYVNTAGVPTAMFACFVTLGEVAAGTNVASDLYLVQSSAVDASPVYFTHLHTADSFGVNELIQIYSDTNGDGTPDYDYRSYAKVFLRRAGYTYDEATNGDIGYATLTYKKYNFPLTHTVDAGVTKNDATVDAYTGMSIQWYATAQAASLGANGPYNFHVLINANNHTYDETYSWVQRQLRKATDIDAGAGTRTGQVAAALVFMDGSTLKTKYQNAVGGVHISNISATSYNNVAEADDTQAYRTYPYTAAIEFQFDSYLQLDAGVAKFWVYDAATYPGAGATLLLDASSNPMTGTISGPTASFSYAWASNKNWVGIAVGDDDGKIAEASGTITQSTGNVGVFTAGKERWKI